MKINKKSIIYVIITIVLVAIVTIGTIIVLNSINNQKDDNAKIAPTEKTVNNLRDEAEKARKANDKEKAKTLLLEAQQDVKELPKTDENTNTKVDIEAQLWLLEHSETKK